VRYHFRITSSFLRPDQSAVMPASGSESAQNGGHDHPDTNLENGQVRLITRLSAVKMGLIVRS
jgi:hypothetical protein